ncbi:hypothetical protein BKG94_03690 [Rodentibacter ratti]|uniref:hypothetical protein n=1 Tax=Rodentibacter ratti TaxID=1906745 RepID=UPI000985B3B2|nr:hypothetical protein [Rodentibacter ratti]OOF89053.1 hypothetical protein BKG94_03690 [Rodentibacter ratti]
MPKIELSSKWSCDGRELKPKFGSSNDAWTFNGKELKPKFGSSNDAWVVSGNTLKPKYGSSYNSTYDLNGQSILVAFGQVILKLW